MDLITLQEYKDFNLISNPKEDTKLSMLIGMVSGLIQTYVDHDFEGGRSVTEVISLDYDTNIIYLENYPVYSIDSITETDRYTYDSTVHVPLYYASDFVLDEANGTLSRVYHPGGFANWPISPGVVTVTYTTGDGSLPSTASVPMDLKLAAIELVNYYKNEEWKSKTIQGTSEAVSPLAKGGSFPAHVQVILDKYKNI